MRIATVRAGLDTPAVPEAVWRIFKGLHLRCRRYQRQWSEGIQWCVGGFVWVLMDFEMRFCMFCWLGWMLIDFETNFVDSDDSFIEVYWFLWIVIDFVMIVLRILKDVDGFCWMFVGFFVCSEGVNGCWWELNGFLIGFDIADGIHWATPWGGSAPPDPPDLASGQYIYIYI